MSEEVQVACNQEYCVAKIYGCNDFRKKIEDFGIEVGKKIVALKSDNNGMFTVSVEGRKRNCLMPKSYFANLSLVPASASDCQDFIIDELNTVHVSLFQTNESYPTGLFCGETSISYDNYKFNVLYLPSVDYVFGNEYSNKRFRNLVLSENTDVFVAVVDFHKLETELEPVVQMMDLGVKIVLVIRGYCEETEDGLHFDLEKMSKYMGIPIVLYDETDETGESREEVVRTILSAYTDDNPCLRYVHVNYGLQVEQHIRRIRHRIERENGFDFNASTRFMAISLLEEDRIVHSFNSPCQNCNTVKCFVHKHASVLGKKFDSHSYYILKQARRAYIDGVISKSTGVRKVQWDTEKIDSILMHKHWGFPLFLLFMLVVFCATFELGRFPMKWISDGMSSLSGAVYASAGGSALGDFVANGLLSGIGAVLSLLPVLLIFYLLVGIMENTGYMTRAAFCVDGLMRKLGLQGKSIVPLVLGFGCSIPAIMSVRNIENKSDRIVASMIVPFLPCAARVPVCLLLVSAFLPKYPALVMFVVYVIGMLLSVAFAKLYSKTLCKSNDYPHVIELPSYNKPTFLVSLSYMWDRTWEYMKRISGIVVLGSMIIWALAYFPSDTNSADVKDFNEVNEIALLQNYAKTDSGSIENSLLATVGKFVQPVFAPLGFDWKMTVATLSGFAGKELTLSTLSVVSKVDGVGETSESTNGAAMALSFVFFVLICFPCFGATSAIRKVSGFKWAALSAGVSLVLAWVVSFGIYQIGILI